MDKQPSFSDASSKTSLTPDLNQLVGVLEDLFDASQEDSSVLSEQQDVIHVLEGLHPSDTARLFQYLSTPHRSELVSFLGEKLDPEVLSHLDETVRSDILVCLSTESLSDILSRLAGEDAFLILEELDEDRRLGVLKAFSSKHHALFEEIRAYPEDSAGRLMQREVVAIPAYLTIQQTRQFLQENNNLPEYFYDVFVVDPKHHPLGFIALNKLMTTPPKTPVTEVMRTDLHKIMVHVDQEEVAQLFRQYALVSAPVVDASGRLLGTITVDDVVHVIDEEAEEDIMHLAGVSESDFYTPTLATSFFRIRWLVVTLLNTLLASSVIALFQATIEQKVAVAVLMPIVAAMGGNSGMQVVTVTVRAIATRELDAANMLRAVWKEILVALLNGLFFACLLGVLVGVWFKEIALGVVLASAMAFNMLWAGIAGTSLPILLHRLGMDPALSAGPILATTTDIFGFGVFLGLATFFLL